MIVDRCHDMLVSWERSPSGGQSNGVSAYCACSIQCVAMAVQGTSGIAN